MGFSVFSSNGRTAYGITNFIVDFPSDIANLSTDLKPGCMAFVMETSDYYICSECGELISYGDFNYMSFSGEDDDFGRMCSTCFDNLINKD